jgi:hypothetical protein
MNSEEKIQEIEAQLIRDNKAHNNRIFNCRKYRDLAEKGQV